MELLLTFKNIIHARVKGKVDSFDDFISFIYGPLAFQDRQTFWSDMKFLMMDGNHDWICLGDLNVLADQSEKTGSHINNSSSFIKGSF